MPGRLMEKGGAGWISPARGGAGPKENEFGRAGRTRPKSLWNGADRAVLGFSSVVWAFKKSLQMLFFSTSQFTHGLTTNDGTDRAKKRPTLQGYYNLAVPPRTKATVLPRNNDVPHKELVVTGITSGLPKQKPAERLLFFRDIFCVRVCFLHISSHH